MNCTRWSTTTEGCKSMNDTINCSIYYIVISREMIDQHTRLTNNAYKAFLAASAGETLFSLLNLCL